MDRCGASPVFKTVRRRPSGAATSPTSPMMVLGMIGAIMGVVAAPTSAIAVPNATVAVSTSEVGIAQSVVGAQQQNESSKSAGANTSDADAEQDLANDPRLAKFTLTVHCDADSSHTEQVHAKLVVLRNGKVCERVPAVAMTRARN